MLTLVGLDQRERASGQGAESSYPQRPQSEHARQPPARCLRTRNPRRHREELPPAREDPGPRGGMPPVEQRRRAGDRKSVVEGKSESVRVDLGGRRNIKNKKKIVQRSEQCEITC